jgi:hypothetical protein
VRSRSAETTAARALTFQSSRAGGLIDAHHTTSLEALPANNSLPHRRSGRRTGKCRKGEATWVHARTDGQVSAHLLRLIFG